MLHSQAVERTTSVLRQRNRRGGAPAVTLAANPQECSKRCSGSTAGGTCLAVIERLQRSADALVQAPDRRSDQPRQQQPAAARADERVGDRAHGAIVGQQDAARAPGRADRLPNRRISPAASASANDRWAGMVKTAGRCARAGSDILERRFGHRDRLRAYRRRTTGPDGRRRSSALPRSRGPTGGWSRTAPRAHRAAGASTAIWTPVKTNGATWLALAAAEASRRGPCGNRPCPCG